MPFTQEDMRRTVEALWALTLGRPVEPCEAAPAEGQPLLTATVPIRGAWEGSVSLRCPPALARDLAASLFDQGEGGAAVGDAEVHDALGELANIIGGNLKGLLSGPCRLGLPTVSAEAPAADAAALRSSAAFSSQGQWFVVVAALTPATAV
jgi:chemotaxis protein CheX